MTGAEIRKAVRTLKTNKAKRFEGGCYRGIIQPFSAYDLFADSEWLDANKYLTPEMIKKGVIGKLHGVEFIETNQGSTESSTVTVSRKGCRPSVKLAICWKLLKAMITNYVKTSCMKQWTISRQVRNYYGSPA